MNQSIHTDNEEDQLNRINLQALQNRDPYITKILDQAQRVCVYKFLADKREWVKFAEEIVRLKFSLGTKRFRRNIICLSKVMKSLN